MYIKQIPKIGSYTLEELQELDYKVWSGHDLTPEETAAVTPYVRKIDEELDWKTITTELAYWRKANQIHAWFVENVQDGEDDCGSYELSKSDLKDLLFVCTAALEKPEEAGSILPTQPGFFFGSTDIDQWYFQDVHLTIKYLKKILEEVDFDKNYVCYRSSW